MPFKLVVILTYMEGMVIGFSLFGKAAFTYSQGMLTRRVSRFIQVSSSTPTGPKRQRLRGVHCPAGDQLEFSFAGSRTLFSYLSARAQRYGLHRRYMVACDALKFLKSPDTDWTVDSWHGEQRPVRNSGQMPAKSMGPIVSVAASVAGIARPPWTAVFVPQY